MLLFYSLFGPSSRILPTKTGTRAKLANRPKKDPWQSYRRVAAKDRTNELAISVVTIDSRDR